MIGVFYRLYKKIEFLVFWRFFFQFESCADQGEEVGLGGTVPIPRHRRKLDLDFR